MKKFKIKILIGGIIFIVFFILNFSFASNIGNSGSTLHVDSILHSINDLLKSIWLLLAIIAGKLYSNDLLYGSSLHLDALLWHIWNFSKMISNFIIGFILIVSIFLMFFGKIKNIFAVIGKVAIASILVNASWFIIAVMIDISTVLLVAVGSFPISLMGKLPTDAMKNLTYCDKPQIGFEAGKGATNPVERFYSCPKENKKSINKPNELLSKMNNMTGPLFYIGVSILNIDKNLNIDTNIQKDGNDDLKTMSISFLIQFITIVLFVVPIILLVIIGIVRIFRLWLYISFSPLILLDQVFGGKVGSKHKAFVLKNMIGLVFQPVLVVFALGISLVFLVSLQSAFLKHGNDDKAKKALGICGKDSNSLCIDDNIKVITIKGNFINSVVKDTGGVIGYMILTILSIMLLWSLIKLSFKSSEITASISDSVYKFSEDAIKQVPIVPTPNGPVGVGAIGMALRKTNLISGLKASASAKSDELTSKIYNTLGVKQSDLTSGDTTKSINDLAGAKTYMDIYPLMKKFIEDKKKNNPDLIPAHSTNFQTVMAAYINKIGKTNKNIYSVLGLKKDGKNITIATEMFEKQEFRELLTGIIKDPSQLDNTSLKPGVLFKNIIGRNRTDFLSSPIKDIK